MGQRTILHRFPSLEKTEYKGNQKEAFNKTHALKRPVPRSLSLSKEGARLRGNESGAGKVRRDVHPLVPQDALLKVGEAGVCHESEDLLVHGDDLYRGMLI